MEMESRAVISPFSLDSIRVDLFPFFSSLLQNHRQTNIVGDHAPSPIYALLDGCVDYYTFRLVVLLKETYAMMEETATW